MVGRNYKVTHSLCYTKEQYLGFLTKTAISGVVIAVMIRNAISNQLISPNDKYIIAFFACI
jgi:hypothetical protein